MMPTWKCPFFKELLCSCFKGSHNCDGFDYPRVLVQNGVSFRFIGLLKGLSNPPCALGVKVSLGLLELSS